VAAINVRNMIQALREGSPTLRTMIDEGQIGIAGAMYDVKTGQVNFLGSAEPVATAAV
jgi:carbonic anhydrase/SulP family sulfate permease